MTRTPSPAAIGQDEHYDAIVVGARPAGAATAMLLGRAGKRVLLVDRGQYGTDTLSTHALLPGAVIQLQRWGLLDAVRAAGTPALHRSTFHYGDDIVDIPVTGKRGIDALYAPRRTVLDRLLVDGARAAGVEVLHGVHVDALRRNTVGRVAGITAHTNGGPEQFANAPITIGADGASSTIARLVGATNSYRRGDASAFIYGYFTTDSEGLAAVGPLDDDHFDWYFRPGSTAGVIPTNGGLANVFVGMPPARFNEAIAGQPVNTLFRTVLRETAPEISSALEPYVPAGRFRSFRGRCAHLRRAHGPGWALVGDAGYFKDPISAHGISDALRDAELLARSVLATGDAAAYEATRDLLARPMLDATTAVASYDWDIPALIALHRDLKIAIDEELSVLASLEPIAA
ncbi:MAG TPA: NAD(P)/FAD-dependent oxidoreductase [Acidimicrobiia bacterium]|nr:NAD(P)/FAD-dependent oxidoreductase [Acidimicrobiia bacterium]